jgi:hypothetical protein
VSRQGSDQVVLQAWRGPRFGTFASTGDPDSSAIHTECYGTRNAAADLTEPGDGDTPAPVTDAQAYAVARALDEWLEMAERQDRGPIVQREHVRAFRASLAHRRFLRDRRA